MTKIAALVFLAITNEVIPIYLQQLSWIKPLLQIFALNNNYQGHFRKNHGNIVVPVNTGQNDAETPSTTNSANNSEPPLPSPNITPINGQENAPASQQNPQNAGDSNVLVIPESNGPTQQNSSPSPLIQAGIPTELVIVLPVVNISPQDDASTTPPNINSGKTIASIYFSNNNNNNIEGNLNSTPNPGGTASTPPSIQQGNCRGTYLNATHFSIKQYPALTF